MDSTGELYINGRNLLSAEFEAETRRFAESLAHPIINGVMDHARDQEPRDESEAPRETDSVDMQTNSKQEDRKDIRNYVQAFVEEMSGMKKKQQQELLFRTSFTGVMERINKDNSKEEHSEVERVNLVNRETGVCNGPFPIADPMPFFQYRALLEGSTLKDLTHAPVLLTTSVLKTMMAAVSGMHEDEFDAIFGHTPSAAPIKGATEDQMDDYEAQVALETTQHWKQFDLFLREHSDTSNGLLLVMCTVVRHIRSYALKNRARAIEILESMLSENPFVHQFFGGRSAVRLQRFVPRAVLNSLRISVDDNQVRHQGFMLFEREFLKDPMSFCFPASYAREVCKAGHALNLTGRECIPLDVVVETMAAYGLNGPELAPNYQLLAVLIYTITRVAVERDNHTIVTYEYVLNMINNWMASPALHPRTRDILPFHYGEMRYKKAMQETRQQQDDNDDEWPLQEQWFSSAPRRHIYEALQYACSDKAGRSLVCIYDERMIMLDGDLDSIDTAKLRIAWDVMYKLDSVVLYCAYKMYERLLKRQREQRPIEMKRIPLDGMCSEQLFLMSCALGYRVQGEHSYPIAPFITLAGMAGSGKTQGLEPFMKILGPRRFLIVSKQHNQKGGILRRFPEARVTTSLMFLHRHQFQCGHAALEPYHLTTATELDNRRSVLQHMRIRQDDRILNEVFHALKTQTRLPPSINEFDYPNPGCIYSEVVGVYAEEFPLTEFQTGAIFLYNLVACSKVEFIVFAGDLNQLPIVSGGNFYRALTNAFYTVMFHHPHRAVAPELTRLYEGVIQGDVRVNFNTPLSRAVPFGDDAPKRATSQDLRDIMVRQCMEIMKLKHLTYHNTQFIAYANNICEWDLGHRFGYMLRHQLEVCPKLPPRFDAGQKVQPLTTDPELRLYKRVVYIVCCVLHVDVQLPDRKSQVIKEKGLSEQARMLCIQAAVQARAQQLDVNFGEMLTAVCVNPTVASVMRSAIPAQAPFLEMHRSATSGSQTAACTSLPRECFLENPQARGKVDVPLLLSERAQYLALKELSLPTRISGATFTIRNIVPNSNVACNRGLKFAVLRVFRGARDLQQPPEEQDVVLVPITRRPLLTDATCLTIHSAQGLEFEHVVVVANPWSRMNRQALYSALTRVICPRRWKEMSDDERKVLFVVARSEDMSNIMRTAPVRPYGVTGSALSKVRAYAENVLGYRAHFNYLECALLEKYENGRFGTRPTPFMQSLREERKDLSDSEFELWVEQQAALFSKHLPTAAVVQAATEVGSKRKRDESDSSCSSRKEPTLMDRYLSSK